MLKRKSYKVLENWYKTNYGLLIDGARQIGKSYLIRQFLENNNIDYVEINLLTQFNAVNVLKQSTNWKEFILRLSTLTTRPLNKNTTVIFIDEIQEFKDFDIITLSKDLIMYSGYKFVFSGSLLGVEQYGISSWPEGYMILHKMFPLDFEEFLWANNISDILIDEIKGLINEHKPIPVYIHKKLLDLFKLYLIVGGMPKAVLEFIDTNDFNSVSLAQKTIESYYEKDVSKYANDTEKILIKCLYDLLPYELNSQNKRFSLKDIPDSSKKDNLNLSFGWFTKADIAIATYNIESLQMPLSLATKHRLVKLFQNDVGILTYRMMNNDIRIQILDDENNLNIGSIYENAVAQMLYAKGIENLYYFSKKNFGEIDFVIETKGKVIPIEVKSGKNYYIHSTFNKLVNDKTIEECILLTNENTNKKTGKVLQMPVYGIAFLDL